MNNECSLELIVKAAPTIDREKLRVRINRIDRPSNIKWYSYVNIGIPATGKQIVCKLYGDDIKEISNSDQKPGFIRINEPLRGKLGISKEQSVRFVLKTQPRFYAWYYFVRYHPDDYIYISTWMAIIAVLLGLLSIILSLCSLIRS